MCASKGPGEVEAATRTVEVEGFAKAMEGWKAVATQGVWVEFGEGDAATGDHGAVKAFGAGNGNGEGGEGCGKEGEVATGGLGNGGVGEVEGGEEVVGPRAGDLGGKEVAEFGGTAVGAPRGEKNLPFFFSAVGAGRKGKADG